MSEKPFDKAANRKLNHVGVKNSANMWRIFDGQIYPHWAIDPTPEQIAAYRAAGVKCRRVGVELFIRETDQQKAHQVDAQHGFAYGVWHHATFTPASPEALPSTKGLAAASLPTIADPVKEEGR